MCYNIVIIKVMHCYTIFINLYIVYKSYTFYKVIQRYIQGLTMIYIIMRCLICLEIYYTNNYIFLFF